MKESKDFPHLGNFVESSDSEPDITRDRVTVSGYFMCLRCVKDEPEHHFKNIYRF